MIIVVNEVEVLNSSKTIITFWSWERIYIKIVAGERKKYPNGTKVLAYEKIFVPASLTLCLTKSKVLGQIKTLSFYRSYVIYFLKNPICLNFSCYFEIFFYNKLCGNLIWKIGTSKEYISLLWNYSICITSSSWGSPRR